MKKTLLALSLGFCTLTSTNSFAESKASFCADRKSSKIVKSQVFDYENRLAFLNFGGIQNGGVCWWHSRFQRNALLLAKFRPDLPQPSGRKLRKIIKNIRKGKKIVEIGGYKNLGEFSRDNAIEIQRELEAWQKFDGVLKLQWTVGLWGSDEVEVDELGNRMDELYTYVKKEGNIAYQMLQIEGIVSHAWLVFDIEKVADGYKVLVLDSNYQVPQVYTYTRGMSAFYHRDYGSFVPYTGKKGEYEKALSVVSDYCGN